MNALTHLNAHIIFSKRLATSGWITCLVEKLPEVFDSFTVRRLEVGQMKSVCSTGSDGFVVKSKCGMISMFRYDGNIHYRAEDSVAICHSWKMANLDKEGVIETPEQLEYIFAIPDSYQ